MEASARPLRADAERNRRRVLDAAREVFAEHGLEVGVETIARAAGVGVGTLYRRFPTKELLLRAILEDRVDAFVAALENCDEVRDPWRAFVRAAEVLAGELARDRALYQVTQRAGAPVLAAGAKTRMYGALQPVLDRAQEAGAVRADVVVEDIPALCAIAARLPAWRLERQPDLWRRYLGVVLDGLRAEGAHPLAHPPPELV